MLIRCCKCGKPVYYQGGRKLVECGYCYTTFQLTDPISEIKPGMIDWKKPLYEKAIGISEPSHAADWMILLGDYADAPQKLAHYRTKELERVRVLENGISIATESWRIVQIIRDLQGINKALCGAETIDSVLSAAREKEILLKQKENQKILEALKEKVEKATKVAELDWRLFRDIEALQQFPGAVELLEAAKAKREKLQLEKDQKDLEELKKTVSIASSVWIINHRIEDINKIQPSPERESILALAYEKRALLLEIEAKEEEKKAKKERWKKRAKVALIAAGVVAMICYGLLSYRVFQPAQLEEARLLAEKEQFAEAEKAYESLAKKWLFVNASVNAQARDGLKELRNRWADLLMEQGDKKTAIEKYELAGNEDAALAAKDAYVAELEEKGLFTEAIAQLKELPGSAKKIQQLYARMTLLSLDEGNYELALSSFEHADAEMMETNQITQQTIFGRWGKALAEQNQTDEAIQKLTKAGKSDEVLELLGVLYTRQAEEKGRQIIEKWEEAGRNSDSQWMNTFARTGTGFKEINAQLRYWSLLADEGIDLTQVYPEGVQVNGFLLPTETAELEEFDASKPLVFQRKEDGYTLSPMDTLSKKGSYSVHDPQSSVYFTVTMLPESWQRLPKERRAGSLRDCTCVFVINLTYQSAGSYYGIYEMEDYASEMFAKQLGKKEPVYRKTLTAHAYFPLFTARMELLQWDYPGNGVRTIKKKTNHAKYSSGFPGVKVVDWTGNKSFYTTCSALGLSGTFDNDWITETTQSCYDMLLGMGGSEP